MSYTVMYSFDEFESLKKWLVLPLPTCRFLILANSEHRDFFSLLPVKYDGDGHGTEIVRHHYRL